MKPKRIVFATGNKDKMKEIRMIMEDLKLPILSMKEAGVEKEIIEDGTTFQENALIKAKAIAELLPDDIVMADDSGLEIDYLNKEPGIYSARYMGEHTSYDIKNNHILERLKGVPKEQRTARFVCAVVAVFPGGKSIAVNGTMEGRIADHIAGENGFGYDPIFWLDDYGCTSAEISPEEKNSLSHRGKALRAVKQQIVEQIV